MGVLTGMNMKADTLFTPAELAYFYAMSGGFTIHHAHLSTIAPDGQPDVVAVGYEFDGEFIWIGGNQMERTRKYKNIMAGNTKVAFMIDDSTTIVPRNTRWFRIYGTAEIVERAAIGGLGSAKWIKITPTVSWSYNMDALPCPSDPEGYKKFVEYTQIRKTVHKREG